MLRTSSALSCISGTPGYGRLAALINKQLYNIIPNFLCQAPSMCYLAIIGAAKCRFGHAISATQAWRQCETAARIANDPARPEKHGVPVWCDRWADTDRDTPPDRLCIWDLMKHPQNLQGTCLVCSKLCNKVNEGCSFQHHKEIIRKHEADARELSADIHRKLVALKYMADQIEHDRVMEEIEADKAVFEQIPLKVLSCVEAANEEVCNDERWSKIVHDGQVMLVSIAEQDFQWRGPNRSQKFWYGPVSMDERVQMARYNRGRINWPPGKLPTRTELYVWGADQFDIVDWSESRQVPPPR